MSEPYDPNQSYWASGNPGYPGPPPTTPHQVQPVPPYPYQAQPYPAPGSSVGPYGAPMYSVYPYPGHDPSGRPGQVVAAAVLSYVEAALLILTGLILFSGSSAASNWSSNGDDHGWGTQFALAGLGDLMAAGLLIAGGIIFTSRKQLGRTLLALGLAVCVVEAIFWISWFDDANGAIFPWAIFYLVMPIIASSMSFAGSISRWLARGPE